MPTRPARPRTAASRRRRQRLRRTLTVLALLLLAGAATSYAVTHRGGARPASATTAGADAQADSATPTVPRPTPTAPAPRASGDAAYAGLVGVTVPWVAPVKVGINDPVPGTTNLQPPMARAYDLADAAAKRAGLELSIKSGWRSAAWQQVLFDKGVARYGSPAEARKWVLPPTESSHVLGLAVDVRPEAAARWLEVHGVEFGLCRRYQNEWWHFELTDVSGGKDCPALEATAGG